MPHQSERAAAHDTLHRTQTASPSSGVAAGFTPGSVLIRVKRTAAIFVALLGLVPSGAAGAELRLHLEPSVALWLDASHADRFASGLHFAVRPTLSLAPAFDVQLSYAILYTPATHDHSADSTGHLVYGGLRVRPFAASRPDVDELGGLFIDANAGFVRMGDDDTFGFDVGVGYDFLLSPWLSVGAVVRYGYILSPDATVADQEDGQVLTIGVDFGFGPTLIE